MSPHENIFRPDFHPPQTLETPQFRLSPSDPNHASSDLEAVLSSKELLRIWSASPWPEDDFNLEQNRADLQMHADENRDHLAYGYMVFTPDMSQCLGSVYINPLADWSKRFDLLHGPQDFHLNYSARVDFWLRNSASTEFEKNFTETLAHWLTSVWNIRALFVSRPGLNRRHEAFAQLGLNLHAHTRAKDGTFETLFFAQLNQNT